MCTPSRTSPAAASPTTSRGCCRRAATRSSGAAAGKSRGSSPRSNAAGDVGTDEMEHVFNLGLGMLAVVAAGDALAAVDAARAAGHDAWLVGEIVDGRGRVQMTRRRTMTAVHQVGARVVAPALPRGAVRDAVRRHGRAVRWRRLDPRRRPRRPPRRRSCPSRRGCATPRHRRRSGQLQSPELEELSGLAASRQHADVLWAHNDSGDSRAHLRDRSHGCVACDGRRRRRQGDRLGRHRRGRHDAVRRRHRRQPARPAPRSSSTASPSLRSRRRARTPRSSRCTTRTARTTPRR